MFSNETTHAVYIRNVVGVYSTDIPHETSALHMQAIQ